MLYTSLIVIFILLLAHPTSALILARGIYAISAVGRNRCASCYLAYDTKGTSTDVYLIPSDTSQPPLWRVEPTRDLGNFLLTAVNRTAGAPVVLSYDLSSCNETSIRLTNNLKMTWSHFEDFLNAVGRVCPEGSAVALAPAASTGPKSCRALRLVPPAVYPRYYFTTWHFTPFPAFPTELYTKGYGKFMDSGAMQVLMDDTLVVEPSTYSIKEATYWRRGAGGVWRRGTLAVPIALTENERVAMGDDFVALGVPMWGIAKTHPFWRVYVYDKRKLGSAPTATLINPDKDEPAELYPSRYWQLAAGGSNLVVVDTKVLIYTLGKSGWGAPVTLPTTKLPVVIQMSSDGRTLAMCITGDYKDEAVTVPRTNGKVLVYRQAKPGGPWKLKADIQPPASLGILPSDAMIALGGDNLAVSFPSNEANLFLYRRKANGEWAMTQKLKPIRGIAAMAMDRDTIVFKTQGYTANPLDPLVDKALDLYVCRRSKVSGKWTVRGPRPMPRWDDDFATIGMTVHGHGAMALYGKRWAISMLFSKLGGRSSTVVTFVYDNIERL